MFTDGLEAAGGNARDVSTQLSTSAPSAAPNQVRNRTYVVAGSRIRFSPSTPRSDPPSVNQRHPEPSQNVAETVALQALADRQVGRVRWARRYQGGLVVIDLLAAMIAVLVGYLARFGSSTGGHFDNVVVLVLPLAWVGLICINRAYEARFVGVGSAEFQRIFQAFLHLTALVAFTSFVTDADLARGFVLVALPLALTLNLLGRFAARKWLHRQRALGRAMTGVLLVGDADAIVDFAAMLRRDRYAGMSVVGACVAQEMVIDPHTVRVLSDANVPILGDIDSVRATVTGHAADTVAVVSSGAVGPEKLRWISWQLEGSSAELVVSPGLTEVAGPRLHVRPMAGLPLLHVDQPEFSGFRRVLKGGFDRAVAGLALILLSPLIAALALAVRLTSSGPAFFRQERVGRNGDTFTMLKFRSMYADAEDRLASLATSNEHRDGVLFKMKDDPRITSIGKLLRKFSLDELPQLVNVVTGAMSLVGPRPPLPREVARYEDHVHRRLLVKPGLTGLWQISGRSNLAWDESVRLDLRYVENWSIVGDLQILWKTFFTVVRGTGAY
ncbi:MAG TPA: sugar transferase [Jatrophihabitans sp.]|jgi:exopolysaccharide biosynthesis polyprenyl glycosylphosphotransferase